MQRKFLHAYHLLVLLNRIVDQWERKKARKRDDRKFDAAIVNCIASLQGAPGSDDKSILKF